MTRLLLTGGAGFIGANLARYARQQDVAVTVLDDLSTGTRSSLDGLNVDFVLGSVLDDAALDTALNGVDAVVHLAAVADVASSLRAPLTSHAANATGTLMVLEACRRHGVGHVVAASSSAVYGANPATPVHEREWVRPLSPYGVSKLAMEQYLLAYQSCYGLSTLAFRFFNVYGPGQSAAHVYAAVIPAFLDALLAGRPLTINGDGTQTRDFVFVGSVCQLLLTAAVRRMSHPEPVNLAFGTSTSLLSLVSELEQATGLTAQLHHGERQPGDVLHSRADPTLLRTLFPALAPVPLAEGLAATVAWFRGESAGARRATGASPHTSG